MKVLTTAGLTKLIQLCKNAIPTVPVTDVTVGGTSVVSSGVAVVPAIPTVNDATLTIQKNGTSVATFTANASSNVTANISVPTTTNDLTNNSGFITSSDIPVTDVTVGGTSVVSSGVAVVPAIPTVNDSTITITQGGVTKGSFTLNQASGDTIALDAGSGGGYQPDLFDWKWADHQLNDVQWLRADTFSWQNGSVYEAAYDHLEADISGKTLTSETVAGVTVQFYLADDGHKICPDTEESNVASIYTATGVAWYYIIDTTNERFKLPRAKHNKYADSLGVVGTGMSVGLFDGTDNVGLTQQYWTYTGHFLQASTAAYGRSAGSAYASGTSRNVTIGLTTDASKSGVVAPQTQDTDQYKYLYFYVGNFTQTALENTAGLNAELFNGKADLNLANVLANIDFVVERQEPAAANNYTWYRKYRSGWVEQGGVSVYTSDADYTVSMPVEMTDTNYTILTTIAPLSSPYTSQVGVNRLSAFNLTTTSFKLRGDTSATMQRHCWQVSGMAAN